MSASSRIGIRAPDAFACTAFAVAFLATAAVYDRLPARVATHFDFHGNPNGWMSRPAAAWAVPVAGVLLWLFVRSSARLFAGVHAGARGSAARLVESLQGPMVAPTSPLPFVAALTAGFFVAIHLLVLYVAIVPGVAINRPVFFLVGALFVALGLLLPRVRKNPVLGVRTPWTLTSDENWARTHRLAGYTMVGGGIVGAVAGIVGGASGSLVATSAFLLGGIVPALYSWILARRGIV